MAVVGWFRGFQVVLLLVLGPWSTVLAGVLCRQLGGCTPYSDSAELAVCQIQA